MKKILFIIFISFYLISSSNATGYRYGDTVKDIFEPTRKFKIDLPPGEWIVTQSKNDAFYGLRWKSYILVRLENGKVAELIGYEEMYPADKYIPIVNDAIIQVMFKNEYDGCYERPEYYYLNFFRKGVTFNCLRAGHRDLNDRVYHPKDPELRNVYSQLKKWLRNNSLDLPNIGFWSNHGYFSRLSKKSLFSLSYFADPSVLNAPDISFFTEETSEYHRNRIQEFPEHEKIMKKWTSISADRHVKFENAIEALDRHLLNLSELTSSYDSTSVNQSNDTVEQLKKLNDLYKTGVLSKEEFEKAKKKILN